jgi:predicted glutamine amidotransferase
MCIIVVIPKKKQLPSDEILRRCFIQNPDGAGLMYIHDSSVVIEKGIMDINNVLKIIKDIHTNYGKKSPIVIHFRIGTSGKKKSPECTHPFPISNDYRDLYRLSTVCNSAIAHNGIIYQYEERKSSLSDTMFFCKMLTGLTSPSMIKRALNGHNTSRFVYMNGDGIIIRTGSWLNHKGIFYSNMTYQDQPVIYSIRQYPQWQNISCNGQAYLTEYEKCSKINLSDDEIEKNEKFKKWIDTYDM